MAEEKHKHGDHHEAENEADKKTDIKGPEASRPKGKADVHTQERVLRFVNAARVPGDLTVLPHAVFVVDEAAAHMGDIPHHFERKRTVDHKAATRILEARREFDLLLGFGAIKDLFEIDPGILDGLLTAFGPGTYGRWDFLYDMEAGGVELSIEHAALLRTGQVIFLESGTDTILWDPTNEVTPTFTVIPGVTTGLTADLFCSGHVVLSDGKLLVVGGGGGGPGAATSNQGWRYDPVAQTWTRTADMTTQRWYPTALMLGDEQGPTGASNRVVVTGGAGGAGGMEVYSEATNSFQPITVSGAITKNFNQLYPGLHLLPGGEIFYAPTGFANCDSGSPGGYADGPSAWFTFDAPMGATSGHWTEVAGATIDRAKGMSVLLLQPSYPFVRVTVIGGGPAGTNSTAQTINLSTLSPTWGPAASIPDGRPRINVSAVVLPDSTILVCGGLQAAPFPTWIYNPSAVINAWREMDEMNRPRHYHSCALLLPSGKVMMAGGASPGGCSLSVENSVEVFSPPYLFNADGTPADRPVISKINGETPTATCAPRIHHGDTFTVETPHCDSIAKVVLVRPMAVTHQTDSEQRVVHMTFYKSGPTEMTVTAPDGIHPHAIAPRGHYMLFILNSDGVPSEGKFIHLH
jgi:hypothetical protein